MNAGLRYLLRKRPAMAWRSSRRRFRGVRGAIALVAILLFVVLLLGPQLFLVLAGSDDGRAGGEGVRRFGPSIVLAFTVLSIVLSGEARGALYFRPEEIDNLFPAPVHRRDLLIYHSASRMQVQLLSAVWMSIFIARYAPTFLGCLLGCFLALAMLQMVVQTVLLMTAYVGKRFARVARWALALAVVGVVLAAAYPLRDQFRADGEPVAALAAIVESPLVRALSLPFVPFVETFAAASIPMALGWAGVSGLSLFLVLFVMTRLDAAYEEVALEASRKMQKKLGRMRSGAGVWGASGPQHTRFSVPRFPRLEGAGAIAWRQAIAMLRNRRGILGVALFVTLWPALFAVIALSMDDPAKSRVIVLSMIPVVVAIGALSTQNLPFDFRRDAARLETLRSLPLRPSAVAAGEIAPAAVFVAILTGVVAGALAVIGGVFEVWMLPLLCISILPFTWAVVALDNALFFVMPQRFEPDEAANLGFMGTTMFLAFGKVVGLLIVLGVAVVGGAAVNFATGSARLGVLTGVGLIAGIDVFLTWLVAWLFDRHDPARDRPD